MEQTRIYQPGSDDLDKLLRQTGPTDATLWIPDLQRPFRWSPSQVTRLLDTLVRGWPFGTLLLWKVDDQNVAEVPARTFWRNVDRVEADKGVAAGRKEPPNNKGYRMVLDGQQRLQSLVVALCGDDSGFRLEDREWWESIDPERSKRHAAKHWSRGSMCLDLENYAEQRAAKLVQHVDYTRALQWVVCASRGGRSEFKRPSNYEFPIPLQAEHVGRYVRLSRLWDLAQLGAPNTMALMNTLQNDVLPEHGVPKERVMNYLPALLDLVLALGQVKQTAVSYLELQPFQHNGFDADQYDDAVVNIFTRLNAGGSALTEEEITFAWIKRHWRRETQETPEATDAFESLRSDLADQRLDVTTDKVVHVVSIVWAVLEREGKILRPSDLLNGKVVGPLAEAVSTRWRRLTDNLIETAELLSEIGLNHREQYESLNAFIVLSTWRFVAIEWLAQTKAKEMVAHNIKTRLDALLRKYATRFMVLTSWAGDWAGTGGSAFARYVEQLSKEHATSKDLSGDQMLASLERRLERWIKDSQAEAENYVRGLEAGRREDVRYYFVPLWVWHRLTPARRSASEGLNLRKSRSKTFIDVDHIVSFASWMERLAKDENDASGFNDVNLLGNCFLLEKNFNISKSAKPLLTWITQLDQYKTPEQRAPWATALDLQSEMIDSEDAELDQLRKLIQERTDRVKSDLIAFVRDETRIPEGEAPLDLSGEWSSAFEDKSTLVDAPLILRQDGKRILGSYGDGRSVEGTVDARCVNGHWSESDDKGSFRWDFDLSGTTFTGTWGRKKRATGGGQWTGKRK